MDPSNSRNEKKELARSWADRPGQDKGKARTWLAPAPAAHPAQEWKLEGPKGKVPRCPGNATTYGQEPKHRPGQGQKPGQGAAAAQVRCIQSARRRAARAARKTTSNTQQSLSNRPRTKLASRSYDVPSHGVLRLPPCPVHRDCPLCRLAVLRPRWWLPLLPLWPWLVFPGGVPLGFRSFSMCVLDYCKTGTL